MSELDTYLLERRSLLSSLLDAVKQCQIRFGGRAELATDSDSRVTCLCNRLEAVLNHGLKLNNKGLSAIRQVTEKVTGLNLKNSFDSDSSFWYFIKEFLNRHEYERYMLLKNISSDSGRGRAWLRSSLNERSLEKYMHMMLSDSSFMAQYYEEWSFMRDQERSSMLPMMSAGLGSILFAINIDDYDLNSPTKSSVQLVNSSPVEKFIPSPEPLPVITTRDANKKTKKEKRKKKRGPDQIVSFEGDEDDKPETDSMGSSSITASIAFSDASEASTDPTNLGSETDTNPALSSAKNDLIEIAESVVIRKKVDDTAPDSNGEISLTSSTSEDSSRNSLERVIPTDLPSSLNGDKVLGLPRMQSFNSLSTQSSVDNSVNYSEETAITILTPLTDTSVELILVADNDDQHSQSDSISIPSFTDDTNYAAQALALTQRAVLHSHPSMDGSNTSVEQATFNIDDKILRSESISKLSGCDLSQTIYSLLQKQDELAEQNRCLRNLLDKEMEISSSLRLQVEDISKTNSNHVEDQNRKIQALFRENEVLKQQLKKYVGAVQMLKRDSVQSHEVLSNTSELMLSSSLPSYHNSYASEAMEYEKKLIQVAEMHGELMEFNEHLHKVVISKENAIKRLRCELIDLRGPLPENDHLSDDDILSDSSENDTSSLSPSNKALINIWIPSAFLTGRSSDSHHIYQVFIRIKDIEWNIYRRYSHFYILHQALRKKYKIVNNFNFPPKKAVGNKDAKIVEFRRQKLQHYLRCVVNFVLKNNNELANSPGKETLVKLMPFFSEVVNENKKKSKKSSTFHSPSVSGNTDPQSYTGL